MSLLESKKQLERDVKDTIRKMITKPNKDQRSIIVNMLRKNAKVRSKQPTGSVNSSSKASGAVS